MLLKLFNLLTSVSDSLSDSTVGGSSKTQKILTYVMLGAVVVLFIVFMVYQSRSRKKQQKEQEEKLNAIRPGCKVKTIGGICGIVVEVCPEDNTFVLETGTEASGKSYLKFDKQAVYQTDAVAAPAEEKKAVEETKEEVSEAPADTEETPAEEVFEEETKNEEEK